MTDFDFDGALELGHRIPEALLNHRCVKLTGRTCDVEFAGVSESAMIPEVAGELGQILRDWRLEVRAQAVIAVIIESADEFDEGGLPIHMPSAFRPEPLQPIRTPGGTIRASSFAVGELARIREAVPGYGDYKGACWTCTGEVGE